MGSKESLIRVTQITGESFLADHTRWMLSDRHPELIIGHEPDGTPSAAVCSLCGEWMAENAAAGLSSRDTIVFFTAKFKVHVTHRHPQFVPN
jgi:hypothetical protein